MISLLSALTSFVLVATGKEEQGHGQGDLHTQSQLGPHLVSQVDVFSIPANLMRITCFAFAVI